MFLIWKLLLIQDQVGIKLSNGKKTRKPEKKEKNA